LRWLASPVRLALDSSTRVTEDQELPEAFCAAVGRRVLLAQLDYAEWVLRRVESVSFQEDRAVLRRVTVDLRVRDDAPVFVDEDGEEYWLVPLTLMRRRTLVDFHMTDHEGRPLTLPGLRLTQQLDQAVLLAAAAVATPAPDDEGRREVEEFVRGVVAGRRDDVFSRWRAFETADGIGPALRALRDDDLFVDTARRMRSSFTLYVFLPVRRGRHRLLEMSFIEPISWRPQAPKLQTAQHLGGLEYQTGEREPWGQRYRNGLAMLGLLPMRIRFQVPSAERAASYHFELTAPEGVRIQRAILLAGRPGATVGEERQRPHTEDHVENDTVRVGLHGVEVPPGSLCRVQVDLRAQASGWIAAMALSGLLVFVVLGSISAHLGQVPFLDLRNASGTGWYTDVVLLLVTVAAGVIALVATRDTGPVAIRLVSLLRVVAASGIACLVIAAGVIAYSERVGDEKRALPPSQYTGTWFRWLWLASGVIAVYLGVVYLVSRHIERPHRMRSPWDMTSYGDWCRTRGREAHRRWRRPLHVAGATPEADTCPTFDEAVRRHGFDGPAIGLQSAEAWHEVYHPTQARHRAMVRALSHVPQESGREGVSCADPTSCPRRDDGRCYADVPAVPSPRASSWWRTHTGDGADRHKGSGPRA
jgi:hypothetical protein